MRSHPHHLFLHQFAEGSGTPIVCLHGLLGAGSDWSFLADRVPGRPIWAVDLPGHGASIGLSESAYSVTSAAELTLRSLARAGVGRFHLVGYSMGGRVAMRIATIARGSVESLLIESGNPGIPSARDRQERAFLDDQRAERLRNDGLREFLADWYAQPVFANLKASEQRDRVEASIHNDREELARAITGMSPGRQPDMWDELSTLDTPMTYVCGERDVAYVRIGRDLAARRPGTRLRTVPECGHAVHRERPADFIRILREHLEGSTPDHQLHQTA